MDGLLFIYAVLIVGAIPASALAPAHERQPAFICIALLVAAWLIYLSAWTKWSPALFLSGHGLDVDSIDIWSLLTTFNGIAVLIVARRFWWGSLLFALLMTASCNDLLYWLDDRPPQVAWADFRWLADRLFVAEVSVFYALGARRAFDLLSVALRGGGVRHLGLGGRRATIERVDP